MGDLTGRRIPHQAALGKDKRATRWGYLAQQFPSQRLGMAKSVYCCCVDPVHASLYRQLQGSEAIAVILSPQLYSHPCPAMAQVPIPIGEISKSDVPNRFFCMETSRR